MSKNTKRMLLAAVMALPLGIASAAHAQYRVGNDGRALDASNQIGSGGYNQEVGHRGVLVTPDDIVYGNVTAGREFRGRVNTFDAREFRGSTAGVSADRFVRNTAGIQQGLATPQPFLGEGRAVQPPPEYARVGFTGGYIPADDALRIDQDTRLGTPMQTRQIQSGLLLSGGLNAQTQQPLILSGSPLYGIRETGVDDYARGMDVQAARAGETSLRPFTQDRVAELRDQLRAAAGEETRDASPDATPTQRLDRPFDAPQNRRIGETDSAPAGADPSAALGGDLRTGASYANRLNLPQPAQQSTQYAELQRRLEQIRGERPMTDAQRQQEYLAQRRELQRIADGEGGQRTPAVARPVPTPRDTGATPQRPAAQPQPPENLPPVPGPDYQPLQITSLAEGIKAEGLATIMNDAEQKMQAGRFLSALDDYDKAQQVAPNNPLVQLGKAHALLGGSYFGRAEQSLRLALVGDPALLLAKYDIEKMVGQKRLAAVVEDLKIIARTETGSVQPMVLLAYIAYNTGNDTMAGEFLTEANKRANGRDALVTLMQRYWRLPRAGEPAPSELNK